MQSVRAGASIGCVRESATVASPMLLSVRSPRLSRLVGCSAFSTADDEGPSQLGQVFRFNPPSEVCTPQHDQEQGQLLVRVDRSRSFNWLQTQPQTATMSAAAGGPITGPGLQERSLGSSTPVAPAVLGPRLQQRPLAYLMPDTAGAASTGHAMQQRSSAASASAASAGAASADPGGGAAASFWCGVRTPPSAAAARGGAASAAILRRSAAACAPPAPLSTQAAAGGGRALRSACLCRRTAAPCSAVAAHAAKDADGMLQRSGSPGSMDAVREQLQQLNAEVEQLNVKQEQLNTEVKAAYAKLETTTEAANPNPKVIDFHQKRYDDLKAEKLRLEAKEAQLNERRKALEAKLAGSILAGLAPKAPSASPVAQAVKGPTSRPSPSQYVLLADMETADVFSFKDVSSGKVEPFLFYLDPDRETTKAMAMWLCRMRRNFDNRMSHRPLVVSGPTKAGKSLSLNMLLPALAETCGVIESATVPFPAVSGAMSKESAPGELQEGQQASSSAGQLPGEQQASPSAGQLPGEQPASPSAGQVPREQQASSSAGQPTVALPSSNFYKINCMNFKRSAGLRGFVHDLYEVMCAVTGHPAVSTAGTLNTMQLQLAIFDLMKALPQDRMNIFTLDEAQSFFLLTTPDGARLDMQAVMESRLFFKLLTTTSPHYCAWAFTGSIMAIIWANVVETPTNGLAMLTHVFRVELPARVSGASIAAAWKVLVARYTRAARIKLPAAIFAECPRQHALLAFMCEQWYNSIGSKEVDTSGAVRRPADDSEGEDCDTDSEAEDCDTDNEAAELYGISGEAEGFDTDNLSTVEKVELQANRKKGVGFVAAQMGAKVFPEVLSDIRLVLQSLGEVEGQLNALVKVFDRLVGLSAAMLSQWLETLLKPYLRDLPSGNVCVAWSLYTFIFQTIVTEDGKLVTTPFLLSRGQIASYAKQCIVSNWGELLSELFVRKGKVKGKKQAPAATMASAAAKAPAATELLSQMVALLDMDSADSIVEQPWFQEVLEHPSNNKPDASAKAAFKVWYTSSSATLKDSELQPLVLARYHSLLRNVISHALVPSFKILERYPLSSYIMDGSIAEALVASYQQMSSPPTQP